MSVVIPKASIRARWTDGHEARRRRHPLHQFLRARGLKVAHAGRSQDANNLIRATSYFLAAASCAFAADHLDRPFSTRQCAILAVATCAVAAGLSAHIGRPQLWETVAMVSVADHFSPRLVDGAAVRLAVASTVRYGTRPDGNAESTLFGVLESQAVLAVARDDDLLAANVIGLIRERLEAG
jgi:ferric-dicitrate binding protein FerR (iron transport regulator)